MQRPQARLWIFLLLLLILTVTSLVVATFWTLAILLALVCLPLVLYLIRALASSGDFVPNLPSILVLLLVVLGGFFALLSPMLLKYKAPPRSYVSCDKYTMRLNFDPGHNTFTGEQEIAVVGHLRSPELAGQFQTPEANVNINSGARSRTNVNTPTNRRGRPAGNVNANDDADKTVDRDLQKQSEALRARVGQTVTDDGSEVMQAFINAGLAGWIIEDIELLPDENASPEFPTTRVTARLRANQIPLKTEKKGLFRYVSEIRVPSAVRSDEDKNGCKPEIQVFAPRDTYLSHNLVGTFSETTLESNEIGQALTATKIRDRNNVIRFSYASQFFQHPLTNKILNFSFLNALLYLGSLVMGLIGYLLGVALDVFKDAQLKPVATAILVWLHLIKKPPLKP